MLLELVGYYCRLEVPAIIFKAAEDFSHGRSKPANAERVINALAKDQAPPRAP